MHTYLSHLSRHQRNQMCENPQTRRRAAREENQHYSSLGSVPYQPNSGFHQKCLQRPPNWCFLKKLCYATSRGQTDFKTKYSNCRHNSGITRPVARFAGLGRKYIFMGKDFNFYRMFETNFSEQYKIWGGTKKIWG